MKIKIKNKVIECEVDEANEEGVGLIKDRWGIKGMFKRFFAYEQVGAYELPKGHGLKKGDRVILTEAVDLETKEEGGIIQPV